MRGWDIFCQLKTWGFRGVVAAMRRLPHEMRIRHFLVRNAQYNAKTKPVPGLTIIAPISGGYSLSKTMRDFVIRLVESGIPHQVFDIQIPDGRVPRETYESLLTPKKDFSILKYSHIVEMLNSPLPILES